MRRNSIFVLAAAIEVSFAVIAMSFVVGYLLQGPSSRVEAPSVELSYSTVARVDGEPIAVRELEEQIAITSATSSRGSAPLGTSSHIIERRAIDALVRQKVQQIAMKEHGILSDISYPGFQVRWRAENARRAVSQRAGDRIYGPVQYSEEQYLRYEFNNGVQALKASLRSTILFRYQDRLPILYESLKDRLFRRSATTFVAVVEFEQDDDQRSARRAKELLDGGMALEQLAKLMAKARMNHNTYDLMNGRVALGDPIASAAFNLAPHHVSDVVIGHNFSAVVVCLEQEVVYMPFGEVRALVEDRALDEAYDAYVDELSKNVTLEILRDAHTRGDD